MRMNLTSFKNRVSFLILIISDSLVLLFSFYAAVFLRKYISLFIPTISQFNQSYKIYLWLFPLFILSYGYHKIYSKTFPFWDEIKESVKSTVVSYIIILFVLFASKKSEVYSRFVITLFSFILCFSVPLLRIYLRKILFKYGLFERKAVIVGSGKTAIEILKALCLEPNLLYKVAAFIDDTEIKDINGIKVKKGISNIERYIRLSHITDVIIAKEELAPEQVSELVSRIQHNAENVVYIPPVKDISVYGTEIRYFFTSQIIGFEIKNNLSNPITYITKRITDYLITVIILPFIAPLMILIAAAVKFSSKGPVIYYHKRIGRKGKEFNCYKFRTMFADADLRLKEILEKDPEKRKEWERYWKLKDDPRITKVGKFLRETSLDELPQIFNVLKGDMSLVGPRPVVKKEIEDYYKEDAYFYFLVPPGITGLWQVSGRSDTSYEQRVLLDCWYVKNWNLWLDIIILFKTVSSVIKRKGAC